MKRKKEIELKTFENRKTELKKETFFTEKAKRFDKGLQKWVDVLITKKFSLR